MTNKSQESNNMSTNNNEKEHETHTTALVILVFITAVIVGLVLSMGNGGVVQKGSSGDQSATEQQMDAGTSATGTNGDASGQDIQPEDVETQTVNTTDDFPSGIVYENAEITLNEEVSSSLNTQRQLIMKTSDSKTEVYSYYDEWMQEGEFDVELAKEGEGSLVGRGDEYLLTIGVEKEAGLTNVTVEYVPINEQ